MKEKIIAILKDINPYVDFDVDTDLISNGILDSLGFLALVNELEDVFDIEIEEDDVYDRFRNITLIELYLNNG